VDQKASIPVISTTVLNWNRADLLRRTLQSYLDTVTVPYELFIVDNGSTDDSRTVIEEFCAAAPAAQAIFLPENIGGAAINEGLARSRAALLHISENDYEYRPGWIEEAIELFRCFPNLGQLSLCAPVPEDEEVWQTKPAVLRTQGGQFVYEAIGNVVTSCLMRREVWDAGVRVGSNTDKNDVLLPDDVTLSEHVRNAGYMCAWAPRYLARNLGHAAEEFDCRREYYARSYDAKPWLGTEGLDSRISTWCKQPRPHRASLLFEGEPLYPEVSLEAPSARQPRLWSMFDGWTADVETLEFLFGLVRAVKPRLVVETRAWRGYATEAIARALAQNGIGRLVAVEKDPDCRRLVAERLNRAGVNHVVQLLGGAPVAHDLAESPDLVVLNGVLGAQVMDFSEYASYLRPGALVVTYRSADADGTKSIRHSPCDGSLPLKILSLPTPRDLTLCQYTGRCYSGGQRYATPQSPRAAGPDQPTALLVLGMHRSGTSALAGVLNLLGFKLGQSLLPPGPANERGFWENLELTTVNDDVLRSLGVPWHVPRRLPENWLGRAEVKALKRDLSAIIRREFLECEKWSVKDPRLCRLLPLWQQVLTDVGVTPAYILPLRNPYDIAASLERRDGLPSVLGLLLWLRYVLDAERYSRGENRVFITYEQLLTDWRSTLNTVATKTGLPEIVACDQTAKEIDDFLSESLRHHRQKNDENVPSTLRRLVASVYENIRWAAASGGEPDGVLMDNAAAELDDLECVSAPIAAAFVPVHGHTVRSLSLEGGSNRRGDLRLSYEDWVEIHGLRESDGQRMAERMSLQWHVRPTVHLVLPLGADEASLLERTIGSLSRQLYSGWGLTVIAREPCPVALFDELPNLEWKQVGEDLFGEVNRAIVETEADWVGLLRAGDELSPHCFFACFDRLQKHPDWMLMYTDEDRIDACGRRSDPWFKSDADPDLLRSTDAVGNFSLIRRDVLLARGGFGAGPGVECYEGALSVLDRYGASALGHIAEVLFHLGGATREAEHGARDLFERRRAVLQAHLARSELDADVVEGLWRRAVRVRYRHTATPFVSIILAVRDNVGLVESCVDAVLECTAYRDIELLVVDEGSKEEDTQDYLNLLERQGKARVVMAKVENNRAAAYNSAVAVARGEYLVFLDKHALCVDRCWLDDLIAYAQRTDVGAVGARAVGANGVVARSALVLGLGRVAADIHEGRPAWDEGYAGRALVDQGVSALPDACVVVRRLLVEALGGFDEASVPNNWYMADLCLKMRERGLRIVWTPHVIVGWQQDGVSRSLNGDAETEESAMLGRWLEELARDPYYNKNLSLSQTDFRLDSETTADWAADGGAFLRVLGMPADTYGCGEYRVLEPLKALDDALLARCAFTAPQEGYPKMPTSVELERLSADVLLLQGALSDEHLTALEQYKKFNEVFRVFDMEDLKTLVPEKNSRRKYLFRNIKARTRRALGLCDRLVVTTAPIAEAYQGIIDDIRIVPNYLPRARWEGIRSARRQGSRPRVGWAGGQQHDGDLELLVSVVEATALEVDWIFFGMCPDVLRRYVREIHEFGSFAEYPQRLAALDLDLAVAPLEYHPFNVAKSNLRVLEYGILGWPVICTDIEPYRGAPVKHVPNTVTAWVEAIRERAYDLDWAEREGDELRKWVETGWMLEDHLDDWVRALSPSGSLDNGGSLTLTEKLTVV